MKCRQYSADSHNRILQAMHWTAIFINLYEWPFWASGQRQNLHCTSTHSRIDHYCRVSKIHSEIQTARAPSRECKRRNVVQAADAWHVFWHVKTYQQLQRHSRPLDACRWRRSQNGHGARALSCFRNPQEAQYQWTSSSRRIWPRSRDSQSDLSCARNRQVNGPEYRQSPPWPFGPVLAISRRRQGLFINAAAASVYASIIQEIVPMEHSLDYSLETLHVRAGLGACIPEFYETWMLPLVVAGISMEVALGWESLKYYGHLKGTISLNMVRRAPWRASTWSILFYASSFVLHRAAFRNNFSKWEEKKSPMTFFLTADLSFSLRPFFQRVIFAGDFQEIGREKIIIPFHDSTSWLHSFLLCLIVYLFFIGLPSQQFIVVLFNIKLINVAFCA